MPRNAGYLYLSLAGLALVAFCALPARAQDNPCGELSRAECAYLNVAQEKWNALYGSKVALEGWKYTGNYELALTSLQSGSGVWIPRLDDKGNVVGAKQVSEEQKNTFETWKSDEGQTWSSLVNSFVAGSKDSATLTWKMGDTTFESEALVSDQYPYVLDSMLSNVLVHDEHHSCLHEYVYWIWGGIRGEAFIEPTLIRTSGQPVCENVQSSWMSWGAAQVKTGPISQKSNLCTFQYAFGFATPVANLKFDADNFGFEITGLGSSFKGAGYCNQVY
jgi:hypothetical protein